MLGVLLDELFRVCAFLQALALVRQLLCAFGRNQERGQQLRAIVLKSRCLRDHANVWWHADDLQHHVVDHDSE